MAREERSYEYHSPQEAELAGVLGLTPTMIRFRIAEDQGGLMLSYKFPQPRAQPRQA